MEKQAFSRYISTAQIEDIREQMLKFANLQLQNAVLAEDVVQEVFLNALQNIDKFNRKAALKTWIFAILKNKIIDYFRQKERFVLESEILTDEEDTCNSFFDEQGHWKPEYSNSNWQECESAVYSKEFWLIFETCLTHLPAKQARVFMMREYLDLSATEVCKQTEISTANLHTLLYRARLQLQHCLSTKLN